MEGLLLSAIASSDSRFIVDSAMDAESGVELIDAASAFELESEADVSSLAEVVVGCCVGSCGVGGCCVKSNFTASKTGVRREASSTSVDDV